MEEQKLNLLTGTLYESVYTLFDVQTDPELIYKMSCWATLYTVVVGIYSIYQPAPYGKFATSWVGPTVNAKFAWMVQEVPAAFTPFILMLQSSCIHISNMPNILITILFISHYIQRSFVYPMRIKEKAKPVPILSMLFAFIFCSFNGLFQSHHLLNVERIENSAFLLPGIILFIIGMGINIHHDGILLSLKKNKNEDGKSDYQIPRGGLFEFVSGANYLGEILEWWGFAIASGKFPQLIFAIFSTIFLGIRAHHQHKYYKKTFGRNYPDHRNAVIPFLI